MAMFTAPAVIITNRLIAMPSTIRAYAALDATQALTPYSFEWGELPADQVEIAVETCGICHSDWSMMRSEWGATRYPIVPGHEAIGTLVAVGEQVKSLKIGQRVGVGWLAGSCMHCTTCQSGDAHLCRSTEPTIRGRPGGFAERMRVQWQWAIPLPDTLDAASAGPLFCGGVTVFSPLLHCGVLPTHRVGVIGIGGLGHLAVQFLNKWGCEVTAFTSSAAKHAEALRLGAHHAVNSHDKAALKSLAGSLDFILVTSNVALEWHLYMNALKPHGRLHFVGAVLDPLQLNAFNLISGQKSISGSPVGSPNNIRTMLDFCARHQIAPQVEYFSMSRVNEAMEHLLAGKARYRIVLQNDFT